MNPAAWNLTGLNPIAQRFNINYPKTSFEWVTPDPQFALWIGDTWRASNSLTINYGMRYTNYWDGATAPGITPNSIPITQYSTANTPGTNIPYRRRETSATRSASTTTSTSVRRAALPITSAAATTSSFVAVRPLLHRLRKGEHQEPGPHEQPVQRPVQQQPAEPELRRQPDQRHRQLRRGHPAQGRRAKRRDVNGSSRCRCRGRAASASRNRSARAPASSADLVYRKTMRELVTIFPNLFYNPGDGLQRQPGEGRAERGVGPDQQPRLVGIRRLLGSPDLGQPAGLEPHPRRRVVHADVQLQGHRRPRRTTRSTIWTASTPPPRTSSATRSAAGPRTTCRGTPRSAPPMPTDRAIDSPRRLPPIRTARR